MKKISLIAGVVIAFFLTDALCAIFLRQGLDNYFGLNRHAKILLIGHSHLMLAADKSMLEDELHCSIAKYCREGVNVYDRKRMIEHFLSLSGNDSLKVVLYGVDQFMFNPTGLSENSYKLFYPFMDNEKMDEYIRMNTTKTDYLLHKIIRLSRYSDAMINSSLRGWKNDWNNYKIGQIDIAGLEEDGRNGTFRKIEVDPEMKEVFEETLRLLTAKGIYVVLVNTPIVKQLNEFQPSIYQSLISYFHSLAEQSDHIAYWDLNPKFSDNYPIFYDYIHLNRTGQKIITQELIQLYQKEFQTEP